jgi:hypothetical protein
MKLVMVTKKTILMIKISPFDDPLQLKFLIDYLTVVHVTKKSFFDAFFSYLINVLKGRGNNLSILISS